MPDIRHRVVIERPVTDVYRAITTTSGIGEWWTRGGVQGESKVGSTLEFYFGQPAPAAVVEVTTLEPDGRVRWHCVAGADEWVGTTIAFDLSATGQGTAVLFTHADWREPNDFMAHCSARWAYFLLSLKSYQETGRGTPFPDDLKF